jgi:hypothetical protein
VGTLRWTLLAVLAMGIVLAVVAIVFERLDDERDWVVRATVESAAHATSACSGLPGIGDQTSRVTSDLPPDVPAEAVSWDVERRDDAERVAACLRDNGGIDVVIVEASELNSFEPTGP